MKEIRLQMLHVPASYVSLPECILNQPWIRDDFLDISSRLRRDRSLMKYSLKSNDTSACDRLLTSFINIDKAFDETNTVKFEQVYYQKSIKCLFNEMIR